MSFKPKDRAMIRYNLRSKILNDYGNFKSTPFSKDTFQNLADRTYREIVSIGRMSDGRVVLEEGTYLEDEVRKAVAAEARKELAKLSSGILFNLYAEKGEQAVIDFLKEFNVDTLKAIAGASAFRDFTSREVKDSLDMARYIARRIAERAHHGDVFSREEDRMPWKP